MLVSYTTLALGFFSILADGGGVCYGCRSAFGDPDAGRFESDIDAKLPGKTVREAHEVLVEMCDHYGFQLEAHSEPRYRLWSHFLTVPGSPEVNIGAKINKCCPRRENGHRPTSRRRDARARFRAVCAAGRAGLAIGRHVGDGAHVLSWRRLTLDQDHRLRVLTKQLQLQFGGSDGLCRLGLGRVGGLPLRIRDVQPAA